MAGMTVVTREAPYDSARKNSGIGVLTATGTGTDATAFVAAATSTQHHIRGGFVTMTGPGTLTILSADTVIASIELPAAGTVPLPPVYSKAGEALNMTNADGATIFVYVEYASLAANGAYIGY